MGRSGVEIAVPDPRDRPVGVLGGVPGKVLGVKGPEWPRGDLGEIGNGPTREDLGDGGGVPISYSSGIRHDLAHGTCT